MNIILDNVLCVCYVYTICVYHKVLFIKGQHQTKNQDNESISHSHRPLDNHLHCYLCSWKMQLNPQKTSLGSLYCPYQTQDANSDVAVTAQQYYSYCSKCSDAVATIVMI